MKLFVKYSNKPPYLPEAVADSKTELAKMLGMSVDSVMSSYSHKRKTFIELEIEENAEDR